LELKTEDFFKALYEDMTQRGTTSRELVGLEFDPESGEISVFGGVLHATSYPALKTLFERIARVCVADGIAVHRLRRITLFEEQITLEWLCCTGESQLKMYPIEESPH
jgi:hypothetical protein